jgi:hypothetical protein
MNEYINIHGEATSDGEKEYTEWTLAISKHHK